jgi:glucuronate isomerase
MKPFITEDFLLSNRTAIRLYREYAENQPILDYHCHLPVREIAENRKFENLTQIWLSGDHYKWRAMRANGVDERYVTGDASDWEKFQAWAETVPGTLGNPLYHWTHLELKRPLGITGLLLSRRTARKVWDACNAKLKADRFSTRGILKQMNVRCVCTTDDPVDTLEFHRAIASDRSFKSVVLPAFRPDRGMAVESPASFREWVGKLEAAANMDIGTYPQFLAALRRRHDFFHDNGCRLSDHGIETAYAEDYTEAEMVSAFSRARAGKDLTTGEILKFKSAMLYEFGLMDHEKGWTQQYHLGALRNVNPRMFRVLGPDTGYDAIGDFEIARPLAKMLGRLDDQGRLAKTIIYNLNPRDNALIAALIGCFQDGTVPGKIQYGSAWWFLDQKSGIEAQLDALSQMGLLSRFVGMLTDSRSFLSYPRHEYFRRILCTKLGDQMEKGLLPRDFRMVGNMVSDICYRNARGYFGFPGLQESTAE